MRKIGFGIFLMGLVAAMLMGTGSAQETGTTQIAAQFPSYITVIAPAGINDWTLSVGDNTYPGTETATVRSNYPGFIDLIVKDSRMGFVAPMVAGKMTSDANPAAADYQLENPLQVGAMTTASLSGTDQTIYTLDSPGNEQPAISFDQQVTYNDYAASYYMIVTFTGTVVL
ncbi:MAG: hypothetical protein QM433_06225 [Euryarchaeota archaeon]|uniref:Uncharacterized protein n=1 Tax=Methanothrix harundinacea TaxID=301375 RepID=A0A117MBB0_9EURY|nr:MAG: hypothetical protein XE07_2068 [Methanothrix harundinacea]MDI9399125.1 hypothetical protein [Euryarchaeota archaeon]